MLHDQRPQVAQQLFVRQFQTFRLKVVLANGFEDGTGSSYGYWRVGFDGLVSAVKLSLDSLDTVDFKSIA
jgi:hypothetical protein